MALENRQTYMQEPALPQQPGQQSPQLPKVKKKRTYFSTQEKLLFVAFAVIVTILSVTFLNKQAAIQQITIDTQNLEIQAEELRRQNVDLKIEVSELSKYERIWEKAQQLGLTTLNDNNVKVVPGQ